MSDLLMNLPCKSLLDEWVSWGDKHAKNLKAHRVYDLCISRGKIKIAIQIRQKYRNIFQGSDFTMAFEYSLMARQQFLAP